MTRSSRNITLPPIRGKILVGGGILLFVALFFRPFAIVNAGERGVVMQLGRVQDGVLDEGFHFVLPFVTSVKTMSVRVQRSDIKAQAASKDLQDVTTEVALNWHITPGKVNIIFQRIGDETQILERIINPAVSEVLKAATAKKNVEEILTKRTELKQEIDQALKTRLVHYGLAVDDVSLVNFGFSPEFNQAIETKQIAEQQAKQAEFVALKATKDAEAEVNRAKGQAEAQRLQRQTLTSELLQKQAIEKWDGKFPVYMGSNAPLPFINITPK
ncbi:MAG: prohibitin family protein [Acaryochloris sp. RU_4_1]|nr:prohibitin family protein [Acaryochloris sp. RU_4_1]NJR56154.1 prohibitin family protein [Acaryochloris sp. CRU_2_0]